jgi:uncharacterized protein (TIGR00290 family)
MNKIPAIFCWSGGKDSAYALYKILQDEVYDVQYLLSTINGQNNRLSMHGVAEALIQAQADSIGIPLIKVYVYEPSNDEYEQQMHTALIHAKAQGIHTIIYGDIYLEDLRQYREEKMALVNMQCIFPLWKMSTTLVVHHFINLGFKSYTCCINDGYLNDTHVGTLINKNFVLLLPTNVDACGENGEYHSYCFDGPIFKTPIHVQVAQKIYMPIQTANIDCPISIKEINTKGFWYAELLLK